MTSSTGCSGLTRSGLPPSAITASRIAARSTTHGTPVKSCSRTRAGMKEISFSTLAVAFHCASARMSSALTNASSSRRSRFSSRIFIEYGSRDDAGEAGLFERGQAVDLHRLAADADLGARAEAIEGRHDPR